MFPTHFHPATRDWFLTALGTPTDAQVEGWRAIHAGHDTLIASPTGSGKTLAAFLTAIDELIRDGEAAGELPDEVRVVYVSPLKALSADVHKNLAEPLEGIRAGASRSGISVPTLTSAVRTGDTPSGVRTAMLKKPPHILVTTPESLYLLLTAERSREMLRTARTVIIDEIHSVLGSRRGAHLSLTLERLRHVAHRPVQRIGLSATQNPIEEVARYLVGVAPPGQAQPECVTVNRGHRRDLDLAIEVPKSPLEAVMSAEVFEEIYDRLAELAAEHATTIVFVNTRRMAERVAKHLSARLDASKVTAHHGSLAKEIRLDAEQRLKAGDLSVLVATASLELGIDIGHVDLVCQLGSTRWISTLLQRVGRSRHQVGGIPRGRLFPLSRDDLAECAALIHAVRSGSLDRLTIPPNSLDVLAQQIVAETACEDWSEDDLRVAFMRAYPYHTLEPDAFHRVVRMVADGYTTQRGRRGALVHYDGVNRRLRGRRAARLVAITAGGAIPDNADYRVVLEPEETFVGTVNEDFAVESVAGDIFQLGNTSWRILQVVSGTVRVADAKGEPPNLPFWFGEAPARSDEASDAVALLRREIDERLDAGTDPAVWAQEALGLTAEAATQLIRYLADAKQLLGSLPTKTTLILERFFDESGGMQLVLHAPFGSRINRAWGLALRKRFCRQFNFELQAAATDNAVLLSLGPQHSFPLDDVFSYLNPATARATLIQALLDAPMFQTRWRWNATISLGIPRQRGGKRVPPFLQRMESEDMLTAVFPDAGACLENIVGDRELPDHPLVRQTVEDCLTDVMDVTGLERVLQALHDGTIRTVSRDLPEPSPLSHEILNAMPYAFLDDAPLEERRTQAVRTRRAFDPKSGNELGQLDASAIAKVADEAWPDVRDADELHDTLLTTAYLTEVEGINARGESWKPLFEELTASGRAVRMTVRTIRRKTIFWVAVERLAELEQIHAPESDVSVTVDPPAERLGDVAAGASDPLTEIVQNRLEILGPTTAGALASSLDVTAGAIDIALAQLEGRGVVLRGRFNPNVEHTEWCSRRLLARIHRYTLNRLRAEIAPVSAADFMRFLFHWQRATGSARTSGTEGLAAVLELLDGFELAAAAWETDVLPMRVSDYAPSALDTLCLTGRIRWGGLTANPRPNGNRPTPLRSTPMAIFTAENERAWRTMAQRNEADLSTYARTVLETLERGGAMFFRDIARETPLLTTQVEQGLGELVARGLATSDGFAGLRALITPEEKRPRLAGRRGRRQRVPPSIEAAGRWSVVYATAPDDEDNETPVEHQARALLRRYGVVFRRLLTREPNLAPWRELVRVYRRMEDRGEIRGGRFVSGFSGEQFALTEAVGTLRKARREEPDENVLAVSCADPLNLAGIVTPGDRVPAIGSHRIAYRGGTPIAHFDGTTMTPLVELDEETERRAHAALQRRKVYPILKASVS